MTDTASPIRGTVIQVPAPPLPGLILADGRQWPFEAAGVWQSPVAPALNQTVDFLTDAQGAVVRISVTSVQQLAADKLCQATNAATEWVQGPGREALRALGDGGRKAIDSAKAGYDARREARAAAGSHPAGARRAVSPGGSPARNFIVQLLEVFLWIVLLFCIFIGVTMGASLRYAWGVPAFVASVFGLIGGVVFGVTVTGVGMTLISINAHLGAIRGALAQRQDG